MSLAPLLWMILKGFKLVLWSKKARPWMKALVWNTIKQHEHAKAYFETRGYLHWTNPSHELDTNQLETLLLPCKRVRNSCSRCNSCNNRRGRRRRQSLFTKRDVPYSRQQVLSWSVNSKPASNNRTGLSLRRASGWARNDFFLATNEAEVEEEAQAFLFDVLLFSFFVTSVT